MTVHLGLVKDLISVDAGPRAGDQIKGVPGSRWDKVSRLWTVPRTLGSLYALRAIFGDALQGTAEMDAWAHQRHAQTLHVLDLKQGKNFYPGVEQVEHLRDYQRPAVSWMAGTGRVLLADEMRTGKTVMTLAALQVLEMNGADVWPALIVAPNTMKFVWRDEIAKFLPGVTVQVINGTAGQRKKQFATEAQVYIINWEGIAGHSRLAPYGSVELSDKERTEKEINHLGLRTVVFDEAHRLAKPKNKWTRAAWYIAHQCTYRYALTGTPLVNDPGDTWSVMHAVEPREWPVKTKFIERYTISAIGSHGGLDVFGLNPGTANEFYRIIDPRFLRRTVREVRPEIPDWLPPQTRWVEMQPKQAKAYDQIMTHMMAELDGGLLVIESPLVKAGRLTQAAAATLNLTEDGQVILEDPSCKIDALMEVLEDDPGEPLVVFSASRKLIDLAALRLAKHGISYGLIVGGQDPELRAATVNAFQASNLQVVLAVTGAGSEGITLNRADRVVFLSRDWSNVKNKQAAARIDGNERPKQVIDIQTIGTIEQAVHAAGDIKEDMLQEIVRDHLRLGPKGRAR